MFSSSTQKKHWVFNDERELEKLRLNANQNFIRQHGERLTVWDNEIKFIVLQCYNAYIYKMLLLL